ncbi:MAG TPA: TetR/AcrR family transcriptional regulator [Nitrospirota bacterium]|jgi:AcrR family transcriptional regulator|nr:TetR/AcrR family transcriptional regulator [Nitrospirota bacterium]
MKKADTKERLFDASLKLISEKGYLGATTREIAQEADVTELTLFRHFGSKERLFMEVLSKYTFLPKLKELLPELERLSYDDALRLVANKFLLTLKQRKPMIKIMYSEVNLYPEKIRQIYNKFITEIRMTLASYFASQQKKGVLRKVSPEVAARMFLGMLFSYFRTEEIMKGAGIPRQKMEKDIRELVDIFIHGTANPEQ